MSRMGDTIRAARVQAKMTEKALGKKIFTQTAGDLVSKKPGKPALVPESDKRPPYHPAEAAFEVVSDG